MSKIKNRKLEIIVFVAGASIMIMELVGARLVAPFLGTSLYVWASLIGIVLGALSLGYYLGGRLADKNPEFKTLTNILFWGGLSILLIQFIKYPVLILATLAGVKYGSIVGVLGLFFLPSVILGIISPYAIRLKIDSIENSGKVAGNLYALSTIGSITGTFLAGFFLIPTFSNSQIILGLSFTMILISIFGNKKIIKSLILIIIIILTIYLGQANSLYVYEADSIYNHIIVKDFTDEGVAKRGLFLGQSLHSVIDKNSDELMAEYEKFYLLDNLFNPNIKKALTIGGGAYVAPVNFKQRYPTGEMTVVEIDSKLTKIAKQYFNLSENLDLNIIHQDGRIFLNNNKEKFDIVYGDAFASYYSIPFHLTTVESIQKIYDGLNDDGIFILNIISAFQGEKSLFFQAEYKTLAQVFPQLYVFPVNRREPDEVQNIIIIASKNHSQSTFAELEQQASPDQQKLLDQMYQQPIMVDGNTNILTDDFAPVDCYISKFL